MCSLDGLEGLLVESPLGRDLKKEEELTGDKVDKQTQNVGSLLHPLL